MNTFEPAFLRLLRVSGPDAPDFVNAQLTIELNAESPPRYHPAAWCDPKGRVLATLLAACREGGVDLVLPASQAAGIGRRLGMYTIGRKVELGTPEPLRAGFGDADKSEGECLALELDPGRFLAPGPGGAPSETLEARWRRADLCQALPWLEPRLEARFLPQILGLEELGGLSYKKGCYPGQEVIARVHYRGRVTRRTTGFRLEGVEALEAGSTAAVDGAERAGQILWTLPDDGDRIGLIVVEANVTDGTAIESGGRRGTLLAPAALC